MGACTDRGLVPIRSTQRRKYLEDNADAVAVELIDKDLRRIDADLPAAVADRFEEAGIASMNL